MDLSRFRYINVDIQIKISKWSCAVSDSSLIMIIDEGMVLCAALLRKQFFVISLESYLYLALHLYYLHYGEAIFAFDQIFFKTIFAQHPQEVSQSTTGCGWWWVRLG